MRFVCKLCGESFGKLEEALEHISKTHRVSIPSEYTTIKAYDEEDVISGAFSGSCVINPGYDLNHVIINFHWVISCTFRGSDLKKLTEEFNTVFSKWLSAMEIEEIGISSDDYKCYFNIKVMMKVDELIKMASELWSKNFQ